MTDLMLSNKIELWIHEQIIQGKKTKELDGTLFIQGNKYATIHLTKGNKFNLKMQLGAKIVMFDNGSSVEPAAEV